MTRRPTALLAAAACGIAFAAAGGVGAHTRITTALTWDRDIAPLVQARCVTCHRDGGRGPMSLASYDAARPWARAIRHQVVTRQMPKWHAARGFGDFANDPSLSPFEIAMIAAWVDGGAPKNLPPKPGAPAMPVAPAQVVPAPFQPPASRLEFTVACGDALLPPGQLLGLRPVVSRGDSIRVVAVLPDRNREILGWFRDVDPDFNPTYWLRAALPLAAGARLISEPQSAGCAITLTYGKSN